jgi:hypothetical protein
MPGFNRACGAYEKTLRPLFMHDCNLKTRNFTCRPTARHQAATCEINRIRESEIAAQRLCQLAHSVCFPPNLYFVSLVFVTPCRETVTGPERLSSTNEEIKFYGRVGLDLTTGKQCI